MKAARAAIAFAKRVGGRITVYYAIDPVPYGFYADGAPADEPMMVELERRARREGEKHVEAVAKNAEKARVKCQSLVEIARPDEGILATARRRKCDAIFIASHGLRGMKRLLLGSVTSRVLANAEMPVIVYR
jgi:nucleotide-binding universal stress UspA family protein